MKKSFISILLLTLVMVLAISAVSAAEDASADLEASDAVDVVGAADDVDDVVADGENPTDKSFVDLKPVVFEDANDEIELTDDYKYNATKDFEQGNVAENWAKDYAELKEGVIIYKDTATVDGKNHYIDGDGANRIFRILPEANVVLKNIEFRNCAVGIYNAGNLTLENCTFVNVDTPVIMAPTQIVTIIDDEASYNTALADPVSALNVYYYKSPSQDGETPDGKLAGIGDVMYKHSWFAVMNSYTTPPQTSQLPWLTVTLNNVSNVNVTYNGESKFNWSILKTKKYGIISVPASDDLNMPEYRLTWGTGAKPVNSTTQENISLDSSKLSVTLGDKDYTTDDVTAAPSLAVKNSVFNVTNIKADEITYGEDAVISGTIDVAGLVSNVNLYLNNTEVQVILDANGEFANVHVADLAAGTYTISFTDDAGNTYVFNQGVNNELVVAKAASSVAITPVETIALPANSVVVTYAIENATAEPVIAVVDVNNETRTIDFNTSVYGKITISNLIAGTYKVSVQNNGNENYTESKANITFDVVKSASSVAIDPIVNVTYGETVVVMYTVVNKTKVTAEIFDANNVTVDVTPVIGDNNVTIAGLAANDYKIVIKNEANDTYDASEASALFSVAQAASSVAITPVETIALPNNSVVVTYTIENKTGKAVIAVVDVNNETRTIDFDDSVDGNITISNLIAGTYMVSVQNNGNENITGSKANITFDVVKSASSVAIDPIVNVTYGETVVVMYTVVNKTTVTADIYDANGNLFVGVTPVIGDNNVTIDGLAANDYKIVIKNEGTDVYTASEASAFFSVAKANSTVDITSVENVTYPNDVVVEYTIVNRSSNVTVSVCYNDGGLQPTVETAVCTIENDKVIISNLTAGDYIVFIYNNEDDKYALSDAYAFFTVDRANSTVDIAPVANVVYGEPVVVYYTIVNRTANVTVSICYAERELQPPVEGANYTIEDDKVTITGLAADNYLIIIFNNEDDKYALSSDDAFFNVTKANSSSVVIAPMGNVTYGEPIVVPYTIENRSTNVTVSIRTVNGELQVPVEGVEYTIADDKVTIKSLDIGNYVIYIFNNDDGNVAESADHAFFNVTRSNSSSVTIAPIANVTYGEPVVVDYAIVNRSTNVTVSICYNDGGLQPPVETAVYTVGENKITITNLTVGNYIILIYNNDDGNVAASGAYAFFNVTKAAVKVNVTAFINDYGVIIATATFDKNVTGNATFILAKVLDANATLTETVEIINGTASFDTLLQLEKGTYGVAVKYDGDANYNASGNQAFVKVEKEIPDYNTTVSVSGNEATITFSLPANATGNVTVYFLSYETNKTLPIVNGTVVVDEIFDYGQQSVLFTYDGDQQYYGLYNAYVDFYVKASSFIKAKNVSVVYNKKGKVTVTLTDNKDNGTGKNPVANADVIIVLKGKQYKGTTNAKGQAVISIAAKLVPKTYTAKVTYKGDDSCYGDSANFKFVIKKATPKITAKKKTFKAKKKTKKYTITLKDNVKKPIKKAKVTIKVGKKTYKAKTNSKGKATFKITKLNKKGKYKAVVTYKGNKYFKKATKKVVITVKK